MIKMTLDLGDVMQNVALLGGPLKESLARRMGVAAGRVFRDEAIRNAPMGKAEEQAIAQYGGSNRPGLLKSEIYVAFNKRASTHNSYTYSVSWNHAKAPHGHWMEFGRWQQWRVKFSKKYGWTTDKSRPFPGQGRRVKGFYYLARAYHGGKTPASTAATVTGRREFPKLLAEIIK